MSAQKFWKRLHRIVNINLLAVATAALLLSYSFSFGPPTVIVHNTSAFLGSASVGMSASVEPNPFNTLAQELVEKERSLAERESKLDQRELLVLARETPIAIYSFILGLILCALVLTNFFFDWRREQRRKITRELSVDLRRKA